MPVSHPRRLDGIFVRRIVPVSRKEAVLEGLRRAIIEGRLTPGARLDAAQIAEEFGVSRMPVRDALKELEADGLVACYPSRGTEVSRLDRHDLEQIFGIRLALECLALRRAVEAMTSADHEDLRTVLVQMEGLTDLPEWLRLNEVFHIRLAEASGWTRLVAEIGRQRRNIERYVRARIDLDGREAPQAQHWALYDACRARDADRACAILSEHLSGTARRICEDAAETDDAASSVSPVKVSHHA